MVVLNHLLLKMVIGFCARFQEFIVQPQEQGVVFL